MSFEASFKLPACPLCSSDVSQERPWWRRARHTAHKTGKDAFIWSPCCTHAAEVGNSRVLTELEELQMVEDAWKHWTEQAFEAKTEKWLPALRDRFKKVLEGGFQTADVSGFRKTPESLPASPAQLEATTNENK